MGINRISTRVETATWQKSEVDSSITPESYSREFFFRNILLFTLLASHPAT